MASSPQDVLAFNPNYTQEQAEQAAAATGWQPPMSGGGDVTGFSAIPGLIAKAPAAIGNAVMGMTTPSAPKPVPAPVAEPYGPPTPVNDTVSPDAMRQAAPMQAAAPQRPVGLSDKQSMAMASKAMGLNAVTPEHQANQEQADTSIKSDIATQGELAAQKQESLAGHYNALVDAVDRKQNDNALKELDRQQTANDLLDQFKSKNAELGEFKLEPGRGFRSLHAGAQAAAVIGSALMGFSAGFRGTQNNAFDQLNRINDDDLSAQKAEYAAKKGEVDDIRNAYGMYRQAGMDEKTSEIGALQQLKENTILKIQADAARIGTTEAQAQAQFAVDRIRQQQAELDAQKDQAIGQQAFRIQAQSQQAQQQQTGTLKVGSDRIVPLGDGTAVVAKDDMGAKALRGRVGMRNAMTGNLQKLIDLERKVTPTDKANPYSYYNQERERLIADTETKKTVFEGQGAMSDGDKKVSDTAIGVMRGFVKYSGDQTKLLQNTINTIGQSVDADLKAHEGPIVKQGMRTNAKGEIEEAYTPTGEYYTGKKDVKLNPVK